MLFVLAGPSYVGKKTAMAHFIKLYSFTSIIPYTTKTSRREGEVEGIQYHYVPVTCVDDITNDKFFYDTPFKCEDNDDTTIYAYRKSDIEEAILSYSNFIIHASVNNAKNIFKHYHTNLNNKEEFSDVKYKDKLYILFLDYATHSLNTTFFKTKYPVEGVQDTDPGFQRRYLHAVKERRGYEERFFNEKIDDDYVHKICEKLEKYILPKLTVMPTSPDKIPGPLSDNDIVYMALNRKSDQLRVEVNRIELKNEEDLRKLLCGCAMHISLSEDIRRLKNSTINNYIDIQNKTGVNRGLLKKLYPEENISSGYVLRPNETILCTSNERITMPGDVFAVVASKFSYTQLGLSIELGTSIIQAGHEGYVHFQIKNNSNNYICIYPGVAVAQLAFFRTVQPSSERYNNSTTNHGYDRETQPPIPIISNDDVAHDVTAPKLLSNKLIAVLFGDAKDTVVTALSALSATILLIFNFNVNDFLSNNVTPLHLYLLDIKTKVLGRYLSLRHLLIIMCGTIVFYTILRALVRLVLRLLTFMRKYLIIVLDKFGKA